jgi:hypothetical protein
MPMTLQDVDLLRREIYSDVADLGGETGKLGSNMAAKVQEFMNSAGAHDIATPGTVGDKAAMAQQAQVAMAKARDAAKRYMNVELIDRKLASATSKAKRTYAGGNIDNRIRQTLGPLMDEDSRKNIERFLHPESFEQLVKTVDGTPVQNAMRAVGRLSPLSGGLKALTSATTAAATHGWSAIGSGVGLVSKLAADNATKRNVSDLMEMIATGGTKAGMLAERQLRALAARNSNVGQWLTAIEHDIAETGTRAAVTTEGDARAQIRDRGNQDYEAQKAAAQGR